MAAPVVVETDPMEGIEVPRSCRPSLPTAANLGHLRGRPDFKEHIGDLEDAQATGKRLQEMASSGRRLTQTATACLHRGDLEGAAVALREVKELPSPKEVMGEVHWQDPCRRLRLTESNQVAWFIEGHLSCLSLMSFFEQGVLTPQVPDFCRISIDDQDDERYLLGLIEAIRELERYGVNRGQALDLESIRLCLSVAQCLEQALGQFDFRNSELRRRFDSVKYCVKKFENLAYEVDLALQRAAAAEAAAALASGGSSGSGGGTSSASAGADAALTSARTKPIEPSAGKSGEGGGEEDGPEKPPILDLKVLAEVKVRYDRFDAARELVLKRSRDVNKGAKNAVYALQRADYRKADEHLRQCAKEASAIFRDIVANFPTLRGGFFSSSLEEMAEALAFRAFRKDRLVLSRKDLQEASGLSFDLAIHEYLGGMMDLTGEVGRVAIRAAQKGRQAIPEVELCLECVDAVHAGARELPYLPMGLGKKMGMLRSTLAKIEGTLYELALLSRGGLRVQAPAAGAGEEDEEDAERGVSSRM